ncbi:MAG TPA: cupin domain-containing protein [Solirubrobacteraceae bacterium]|nr:cupin domain-containing protein [Solirubrobacteraceae bacterium]
MSRYTIMAIGDMAALHHGAVRLAAAELGVESFGLQVLDLPAGFRDYPEHNHAADGQEEVYVLLRGSGEFEIDGDRVPIDPGSMLRIDAAATRMFWPGAEGARVLAIGCAPAGAYERPEQFSGGVRP